MVPTINDVEMGLSAAIQTTSRLSLITTFRSK
jgi:hypothetical protein